MLIQNELYWVQLGILDHFINTDRPASYKPAGHLSRYPGRLQLLKTIAVTGVNPHIARAINI